MAASKFNYINTLSLKTKYLLVFFVLLMFAYTAYQKFHQPSSIKEKISKINSQEKEYLTNFFKYSFYNDGLGFVVFYDRPMNFLEASLDKEELPSGADYMHPLYIRGQHMLEECWSTWQKYSTTFALKDFSILAREHKKNNRYYFIFFINHINFKNIVARYIKDFHEVLKNNLTPQEILDEFIKEPGYVYNTIMQHDGLLGTLLGFGRDNAWEFLRLGGGKTMGEAGYSSPEVSNELPGVHYKTIVGSLESESLEKKYEEQRQALDIIYQGDDLLEQVLNKISG